MRLTLAEVLEATGGRLTGGSGQVEIASYHTDSRDVLPGGLSFALRGRALDGHDFCAEAAARGASAVICERDVDAGEAALIRVGDCWRALYDLADHVLRKVSPLVVGITGSNGKTSTKELTAAVLGVRHRVLKTDGNRNTETGLPLTLLQLEPTHTAAVLEMGMQGPGEIARLARLARPRVGIVTMVGSVHLERFVSATDLALAKGELVAALPPDGLAVLHAQNAWTGLLRRLSAAPVTTFGLGSGDVRGECYRPLPEGGSALTACGVPVRLCLDGRHQAANALAALAAGRFAGVPLADGAAALASVRVPGRMEPVAAPGGYVVLDDAYTASPESMLAAFEVLAERPRSGRLLALLGEMRELGPVAAEAHRAVGRRAGELFDRVAVLDAGHGRLLAEASGAELVPDRSAATNWVRVVARPGDVVLVKASHGLALQAVVWDLVGKREARIDVGSSGGLAT